MAATGMAPGFSLAEDVGSCFKKSFNYIRSKFIGPLGIPTSTSVHTQAKTNDPNDLKTMKTAEGLVAGKGEVFKKMELEPEAVDKHCMGLHDDGQVSEWQIGPKVCEKYWINTLFCSQSDTTHKLEIIFNRVKFYLVTFWFV